MVFIASLHLKEIQKFLQNLKKPGFEEIFAVIFWYSILIAPTKSDSGVLPFLFYYSLEVAVASTALKHSGIHLLGSRQRPPTPFLSG